MVTREPRTLSRDVEVAAIPYGDRLTLTLDHTVVLSQILQLSPCLLRFAKRSQRHGRVLPYPLDISGVLTNADRLGRRLEHRVDLLPFQ